MNTSERTPTPDDDSGFISPQRRLGQHLHAFSNMVSASYFQRTEKSFGVALAEWRVLRSTIISPGVSQSEIALAEGLNVMNVSRAVASLRRKGLLDSKPDPDDGRRMRLTPTTLGFEIGEDIGTREELVYEYVFSQLSAEELAQFDELMGRVNGVLRSASLPEPPEASRPWRDLLGD